MENNERIKTIILVVLGVATVVAIGLGTAFHSMKLFGVKGLGKTSWGTSVSDTVSFNGNVSEVSINLDIAELNVEYGDSLSVNYDLPEKLVPEINMEGSTLVVKSKNDVITGIGDLKDISTDNYKITVTIPKDTTLSSLQIDVDCGDLRIEGLGVDEFNLNADCGDIRINGLTGGKKGGEYSISADLGNVVLDNITCSTLSLDADCGNIEVSDSSMNIVTAENSMGNVELKDVKFNDGTAKNDMGDIKVNGDFASLSAECSMGSIKVETDRPESEVNLDLEVNLGDIKVNGKKWK